MIHILPPEIANRIAAGEVVERPASVVRELIDNAVDAGATRIDIEIEQGGLQSIRVTDNGCGMSPDDAALCSKRHATSKILTADDLNAISTKGFRGEALAAIGSIAKVEIKTRPAQNEWGTRIQIEGGIEQDPESVGTTVGTSATIRDLFFNTPARRKFLKKPATEMNHVLSTITWNALAHEDIHFTFAHNGRRSLDIPPVASRAERIQQLFGKPVLDEMIPIQLDTPILSLTGFISRPTLTRNGAQHVFFFVNDRFVKDRLLHRAMMNGYRNLIHAGRYPVVFLYLEINPEEIDINVHPTKQEIKFSREDAVFSAMYGAIRQAWDTNHQTPETRDTQPLLDEGSEPLESNRPNSQLKTRIPEPIPVAEPIADSRISRPAEISKPTSIQQLNREHFKQEPSTEKPDSIPSDQNRSVASQIENVSESTPDKSPLSSPLSERLTPEPPAPDPVDDSADFTECTPKSIPNQIRENASEAPLEASPNRSPEKSPESSSSLPLGAIRDLISVEKRAETLFDARSLEDSGELTVLGQLMSSYILAEGKDGLYIIDQHAAHERLLFEQFLTQSQKSPLASQTLLFPITMDFPPDEVGLVEELTDLLKTLGFSIEPFGGHTFVMRSIPSTLEIEEAEQFIKDFLGEVRYESSASEYKDKALHTLSCRAAVKFGDELTIPEMEGIIRGLQKIPRRNVCPHGRPAILFVAEPALQKAFKRTGF